MCCCAIRCRWRRRTDALPSSSRPVARWPVGLRDGLAHRLMPVSALVVRQGSGSRASPRCGHVRASRLCVRPWCFILPHMITGDASRLEALWRAVNPILAGFAFRELSAGCPTADDASLTCKPSLCVGGRYDDESERLVARELASRRAAENRAWLTFEFERVRAVGRARQRPRTVGVLVRGAATASGVVASARVLLRRRRRRAGAPRKMVLRLGGARCPAGGRAV